MDKSIINFIRLSTVWITVSFGALLSLIYTLGYMTASQYSPLLIIIVSAALLISVFLLLITHVISNIFENGCTNIPNMWLAKIGTNFLLPALIFLPGIFKNHKDTLRNIYVNLSNTLIRSQNIKYPPEKVLLLIPHCLQNSKCAYNVTDNIDNCRKCGRCGIGNINDASKSFGIPTKVVNGGTAARNIIKMTNPQMIIAVACERELTSGMLDINRIPVIGILNQRPDGQCSNTTVNVNDIKQTLEMVVEI